MIFSRCARRFRRSRRGDRRLQTRRIAVLKHMADKFVDGAVIEEAGARQFDVEGFVERAHDAHAADRVHAVVGEGAIRIDPLGRQLQRHRQLGQQRVLHMGFDVDGGHRFAGCGCGFECRHGLYRRGCGDVRIPGRQSMQRRHLRDVGMHQDLHGSHRFIWLQGAHTGLREALAYAGRHRCGRADVSPEAPVDRLDRTAEPGGHLAGQRILIQTARAVIALACLAGITRQRREEQHAIEGVFGEHAEDVGGNACLDGEGLFEMGRVHAGDASIVKLDGRVDHAVDLAMRPDRAGARVGQRCRVRRIRLQVQRRRAERGQPRQFPGNDAIGRSPSDPYDARAIAAHQVLGEDFADPAGTADDHVHAVLTERAVHMRMRIHAAQALACPLPCAEVPGATLHIARYRSDLLGRQRVLSADVDQPGRPLRMFLDGAAHQPLQRGVRRIVPRIARDQRPFQARGAIPLVEQRFDRMEACQHRHAPVLVAEEHIRSELAIVLRQPDDVVDTAQREQRRRPDINAIHRRPHQRGRARPDACKDRRLSIARADDRHPCVNGNGLLGKRHGLDVGNQQFEVVERCRWILNGHVGRSCRGNYRRSRCRDPVRPGGGSCIHIHPTPLLGERICRQMRQAHARGPRQVAPLRLNPAHPPRGNLRQTVGAGPCVRRCRRVVVRGFAHPRRDVPDKDAIPGAARQDILESGDRVPTRGSHERQPLLERRAPDLQGERDIGQRDGILAHRITGEKAYERRALRLQCFSAPTGHHEQNRFRTGRRRRGRFVPFLQHQMRVGAAVAERTDGRASRDRGRDLPFAQFGVDDERRPLECAMFVRSRVMQRGHQTLFAHGQDRLVHTGHAGRCRRVADVALHRSERAEMGVGGCLAKGRHQRFEFDRIAQFGTGAVGFDVADRCRVDRMTPIDVAQQVDLAPDAGRGDAVGAPILIDAGTEYDRMDAIIRRDRIAQPLEHEHADRLAGHETVGGVIERAAASGGGQHPRSAHADVAFGREIQGDAAGQRKVDLAGQQRLACQMGRHQRRRTCGIDRDRRAFQVQVVGDARRGDRSAVTRRFADACAGLLAQIDVLVVHDAEIDAAASAVQRRRRISRVFERTIAFLQEQPVLRVHHRRFRGRDTEEQRIEIFDLVEHAQPFAIDLARLLRPRVVIPLDIPARRRNLADRRTPFGQQVPECVERCGTRVTARHPHDRDALARRLARRQPCRRRRDVARGQRFQHCLRLIRGDRPGLQCAQNVLSIHIRDPVDLLSWPSIAATRKRDRIATVVRVCVVRLPRILRSLRMDRSRQVGIRHRQSGLRVLRILRAVVDRLQPVVERARLGFVSRRHRRRRIGLRFRHLR